MTVILECPYGSVSFESLVGNYRGLHGKWHYRSEGSGVGLTDESPVDTGFKKPFDLNGKK